MYNLPNHKEHNEQVIKDFIKYYPFAFITGVDARNQPVATQVPLFLEERSGRQVLRGHIMKNTDHHKAFLHNKNVLAVFTGKHTYVSGTWYSNPHTPSTWNYMSVHINGIVRLLEDAALEEVLRMTTLYFEDQNHQSTTVYDNIPEEFRQRVMGAIVAFEVEIQEIDTVFKLSQDRDAESYRNIIEKLMAGDEDARVIAQEMIKREKELFSA